MEQDDHADQGTDPLSVHKQPGGFGINIPGILVSLCGAFSATISVGGTPRLVIEGVLTEKATDGTVCPFPEDRADDIELSPILGGSRAVRK